MGIFNSVFSRNSSLGGIMNLPSLLYAIFWGKTVYSDYYDSRLVNGNEFEAVPSKSNSIYFNGVDSVASITFSNDVLMYVTNVIDKYSEDGIELLTWQTGDIDVSGLFEIDTDNRTLNIMFDGTNYKEGYQTYFALQRNNDGENETFLSFSFSEGLEGKSYAIETDEKIAEWENYINPWSILKLESRTGLSIKFKL